MAHSRTVPRQAKHWRTALGTGVGYLSVSVCVYLRVYASVLPIYLAFYVLLFNLST
jgi:hypothetical protein